MRTLASTFSTKDEAEAARRRLEAIGIGRERIIMKDVAETPAAPGGAGAAGGVFVSVKVTTEQVQPASEVLKGRWTGPEPAVIAPVADVAQPPVQHDIPPSPPAAVGAERGSISPRAEAGPQFSRQEKRREVEERARLSRYLIFYGLALVAAFMIGAWLGKLG